MAILDTMVNRTRLLIRDNANFHTARYPGPLTQTLRLSHPLVSQLFVTDMATGESVDIAGNFQVDARNGVLLIQRPNEWVDGLTIAGYFYEWFLDIDLRVAAEQIVSAHMYERQGSAEDVIPDSEIVVMCMGVAATAYFSLLSEISTDTDVTNPEGIHIPNSQRFQQVMAMYNNWQAKYDAAATALNVGYSRMSVTELRRISNRTGRYTPVLTGREIDDPRYPQRLLPPIEPPFKLGTGDDFDTMSVIWPQEG